MITKKLSLRNLCEKNFIWSNSLEDAEVQITAVPGTKVFSKKKEKFYSIEKSSFDSDSTVSPCIAVPFDMEPENVLKELGQMSYAAVLDEQQRMIGYLSALHISSKLLMEYQQLNAYMETILDTVEDSCTIIDSKAEVLYWTKEAEKIFSVDKEKIVGKPIIDFFSEDKLEILNTLRKGTSLRHRQHQAREDLVVLINSNPVYHKEEIIGAVVSERDITSQIRLNNELYKTSEKLFTLENEMRKSSASKNSFTAIRGNSPALKQTMKIVEKASRTNASVLVYGESGVGKELFAKAIHNNRELENAPFIAINCGAIPNGLFESEIFGYEKGAFSGADQKGKKGKVELAKGGTLFLDEIADMPFEMQVKILRLLQEKKFYPVGGTKEIEVDFRVVAATNRDLKELVKEGKFREDLYYRLNVVNFTIPPLRERPEDIIELTHYFLYEISTKYKRPIHGISQEVMQSLLQYYWPGNIRELRNIIERLIVFSDNGEIKIEDLPAEIEKIEYSSKETIKSFSSKSLPNQRTSLSKQLQEVEKDILIRELDEVNGNKQLCAKNLEITRTTLYNRLNKLGIST